MAYQLPDLPYAYDALEPYIDARTMEIHHGKHHQTYVDNLNKVIAGHAALEPLSVEELISNLRAYRQVYGEYPPSLEAFGNLEYAVDPFSAAPFVYRRAGDDIWLYSVGGNGVDDAGVHNQKGDTNDLRFWPRPE